MPSHRLSKRYTELAEANLIISDLERGLPILDRIIDHETQRAGNAMIDAWHLRMQGSDAAVSSYITRGGSDCAPSDTAPISPDAEAAAERRKW